MGDGLLMGPLQSEMAARGATCEPQPDLTGIRR